MDPMIAAGLISTAGGLMSNAMAKGQSTKERAFNANQALLNRQFQERMSSTAYQRMTRDMKKAGLNPLLGLSSGGASTPSGSQAQTTATPVEDFIGKGLSSAIQAKQLKQQIDKQDKELDFIDAQIGKTEADKNKTNMETNLLKKDLPKAETIDFFWSKLKEGLDTGAKQIKNNTKPGPHPAFPQYRFKQPPVKHNYPKR